MLEIARRQTDEPVRLTYGAVERRPRASAAEIATYLQASRPVIIERALDECPASARWSSPAALAERVGDVLVPLTRSASGSIRYYRHLPQVPTPFSECVRRIFSNDGVSYYVHQTNLLEQAPQLAEDLVFPYPELGLTLQTPLFWIGSGDTVSRLHCDFPHNFIAQFRGRKRFRIFPHHQAHHFYPPPPYTPDPYHTPVSTMGDTSLEEYPWFAGARGLEAVVNEGEMLVLPSLWWHQVIAEEPSVMVNWFGLTPAMDRDWPRVRPWALALAAREWEKATAALREIEEAHVRDAGWAASVRLFIEQGELELARHALQQILSPSYAEEMAELFSGRR